MALCVTEQPIIVAEDERPALEQLARIPTDDLRMEAKLIGPGGEEIPISASLRRVLGQATQRLTRGEVGTRRSSRAALLGAWVIDGKEKRDPLSAVDSGADGGGRCAPARRT